MSAAAACVSRLPCCCCALPCPPRKRRPICLAPNASAGVYEYVAGEDGRQQLQINAQNCLHCKVRSAIARCQRRGHS